MVFEDTIPRICDRNGIEQSGRQLDTLISALATENVIMQAEAHRARAAAHVRAKATHAPRDEFTADDVGGPIALTDERMLRKADHVGGALGLLHNHGVGSTSGSGAGAHLHCTYAEVSRGRRFLIIHRFKWRARQDSNL